MENEIKERCQLVNKPMKIKQTNKHGEKKKKRKNIKSIKGKATSNIQGKPHTFNS